MIQEILLQKAAKIGQALAFGSTLALSPLSFASSATTQVIPLWEHSPSSVSVLDTAQVHASDIQRAIDELHIALRLLAGPLLETETAIVRFLNRLDEVLDSVTQVSPGDMPRYSRNLADTLYDMRIELLEGVMSVRTWTKLSRAVDPTRKPVLPERFITRKPAAPIALSPSELQIAEYLRSPRGPNTN